MQCPASLLLPSWTHCAQPLSIDFDFMSAADYLRDSVAQEALAFLSLLLRVPHLHNVHITIAWPKMQHKLAWPHPATGWQ